MTFEPPEPPGPQTFAPVPPSPPVATPEQLPIPEPPPKPAAPPPAAPGPNCNPSFIIDADGTKHFKPECFSK
jgi:hypothetical protein